MKVTKATAADHQEICKIAKMSKYTKDFSNMIFSSQECYDAGRIRVAKSNKKILGFTCFRHRKRDQTTVLYFIGVHSNHYSKGVGSKLLDDLWEYSTGTIEFKVMKDNLAVKFYTDRGFAVIGEAYNGKALVMRQENPLCT